VSSGKINLIAINKKETKGMKKLLSAGLAWGGENVAKSRH
tara:strand:+ start:63 stop:182 length:120 start_codon:yes stop_codon:yes gene_type:complete